ncbi:MAG: sulfatase [Verrucomicrobiaceae bacterium]|nr:sulfatase [Verrucomicrobiaceae bacterium]
MKIAPLLLTVACHFLTSGLFAAEPPAKPNFVIINIDDLGYADIGPFGSTLNRTPHLDRMAKEGKKLTSFYAAPVCSPSRSSLMTGCYPKRVLPISHVLFPAGAVGLNPQETTVAEVVKTAGYATACVGKWHLGDQPEFLPTAQGFDEYLGIPYSNDMGPAEDGSKSDLGAKLPESRLANLTGNDELGLRGHSQPPLPLLKNNRVIARVRQDEQQGIVERYTTAALDFIQRHREQPFLLYLPHNAVHFPLYPGKAWAGKSPHGYYSDWVEEVDWSVGRVLDTLRQLGLDKKTLVLFTSDNGGTPRAVNKPLRGHKGSTWEGGIRTSTIAWWPGQIPAGTSSAAITGMFDVLPTIARLSGGPLPSAKLDGADIWPILSGASNDGPHETFYYFRGLTLEAVRQGPWKLHLGLALPAQNKGKAKAKSNGIPTAPELYQLENDPGESNNQAASHPEIVQRLQALATAMDSDLGTREIGPGCRTLGRVTAPQPLIDKDGKIRAGFEP